MSEKSPFVQEDPKVRKRKKVLSSIGIYLAFMLFLGVAGYSIMNLWDYTSDSIEDKRDNDEIAEVFHKAGNNPTPTPVYQVQEAPPYDETADLLDKYNTMKALNHDYAFWLQLNGTGQEYPVCVNPSSDGYYYLKHNFKKRWAGSGCLFLDPYSDENSDNYIVYGHHMRNGSMFGKLYKYENADWVKTDDNNIIEVYTATEHRYYEVVSVFTASVNKLPFNWSSYSTITSVSQGVELAKKVKESSQVDLGYEPGVYDDRFLILVTCEYTHRNGREVVIARQLGRPTLSQAYYWEAMDKVAQQKVALMNSIT